MENQSDPKRKQLNETLVAIGRVQRCRPVLVGNDQPLRIVAPFGMSSRADLYTNQVDFLQTIVRAGADIVQELSTYGPYSELRSELIQSTNVPYGTVLTYELFSECSKYDSLSNRQVEQLVLQILHNQIEQGIDYVTIHASLSQELLDVTAKERLKRAIPIPSRSAGMLIRLMRRYKIDNPLNKCFDDIARMCGEAGVVISLGGSLRSAAISDALDEPQLKEVHIQSSLTKTAQDVGAQVMIEGLSHGLPEDVDKYYQYVKTYCPGAPVTALGPLPIDIAVGMDHVAAAVGVTFAVLSGISLVNVVTAKEHIAMPTVDDMVEAIRATKIGAYIAETIREGKNSRRDRMMSEARSKLSWTEQSHYALLTNLFDSLLEQEQLCDNQPCRICKSKCPFLI